VFCLRSTIARSLSLAALLCSGCAMKHVQVQAPRTEIVITRACMDRISLTEATKCTRMDDDTKFHCEGIKIDFFKGCEVRQVVKTKKGESPK
jgi:hypothetical protein